MKFPSGFCITSIKGEKNDFGLIFAPLGMKTAGMFTTNSCPAHPVKFSRDTIKNPVHKAILVNKGSANSATGNEGKKHLKNLVAEVCNGLVIGKEEVLVASTGVIGKQLQYTDSEINRLIEKKERVEPDNFAQAIMTTDTCKKVVTESFEIDGKEVIITGIAKGSGMIAPDLATMLAFILTDVRMEKEALQAALKRAADISFNCLNIDGETSTNDSVFLAASGTARNRSFGQQGEHFDIFYKSLKKVCILLVEKLTGDGEGATKFIKINIRGAVNEDSAKKAANAIAVSPLCKIAFYGASPNWGRIISALGAARIKFRVENFSLYINSIPWVKKGIPQNTEPVKKALENRQYEINIHLNSGNKKASLYTCDFSPEYVKINAHYS